MSAGSTSVSVTVDAGAQARGSRAQAMGWRALDLTLACALLLVCAPLMAIIAIAIRLESHGPAFFRQRRLGRDMRPFVLNKFRTMHANVDDGVHRAYVRRMIAGDATTVSDGKRSLYKLAVDDRVTRLGRVLRRTSLDELPQLFNVVRGSMSLVGPRPVIPYEVEQFPEWYLERFVAKPGLTGLWQVSGRSRTTYEQMVAYDIEFVRTATLGLYLKIVARTVWVLLACRDAA